ncbi:MAG: AAA family ATPase [Dermatophilaceae bacterium]
MVKALNLVEPGSWTTYGDLAELVQLPALTVGQFLARNDAPNPHRVLQSNGRVSPEFAWQDPTRTDDPKALLVAEGVEFDGSGRANPEQRLDAADLRELLREVEVDDTPSRRAWLVRGSNVNGVNLVPTWLAKGSCSLAASQLRQVETPIARGDLAAIVEEDYSHVSYNARREKVIEFDTFLNRMQVDDLAVTTSEGNIYVGRITGVAEYVPSQDNRSNLRRAVEWVKATAPVGFTELTGSLKAMLSSQHSLVDLTSELATLDAMTRPADQPATVSVPSAAPVAVLPDATDQLAESLLVDREWLQECVELLRDRRQLIFYGPPGTGKTYIAQELAEHVTAKEAVTLVQFHPAYSYEDFFEGFRPTSTADGHGVGFTLTPGPFRRLVDAARENPGTAYLLIIDEINRANLAKVFGELYFLLEYRDKAVDLLYSDDTGEFTLPTNVYLIGTMNTADRSIALVDAAMRRRFAFVQLHPSEPPTSQVLRRWLARTGRDQLAAQALDALNDLIEDADLKIGPSYFMRDSVYAGKGMERMWRTSILPLLEEHHYGEGIDVPKRYSLERILAKLTPPTVDADAEAAPPSDLELADLEPGPDE